VSDIPTFQTTGYKRRDEPPFRFRLAGERMEPNEDGAYEEWDEVFTCVKALPAGVLAEIGVTVGVNDRGELSYGRQAVVRFLRSMLVPEDRLRYDELVHDTDRVVEVEDLGPIMILLIGKLSAHPSGPRTG
jgi:hypothetical protein